MLGIDSYRHFVEQMTKQVFPETTDRDPYQRDVYFAPFGGFGKRYALGSRFESGNAKLAPQTASLQTLVRATYWLAGPHILSLLLAIMLFGHTQFGWFSTLTRARELYPIVIVYLLAIVVFYLVGVALLTRGLKASISSGPLTENAKKVLMENGMTEQNIHRAQAHHKSSFYSHMLVNAGQKTSWATIIFGILFFSIGFFVGWDTYSKGQVPEGISTLLFTAFTETLLLYILLLKIRWHRMGSRK